MALTCPACDHPRVDVVEFTDDARMLVRCGGCDHEWTHPPKVPVPATGRASTQPRHLSRDEAHARFPTEDDLTDAARRRLLNWKDRFLTRQPTPDPRVADYFERYRRVFSATGLPQATPAELKSFANNSIGARPGNMSVFNRAWNALGDEVAAAKVRRAVEYLLRGTEERHIEDRMQTLIVSDDRGMTGFRESLLTRVLCVVEPTRFLPILTYTSPAGGKKEIAAAVFDLELPAPSTTSMTAGRLAFWSNDLLLRLCGPGFVDVAHASEFLWWAKDQTRPS